MAETAYGNYLEGQGYSQEVAEAQEQKVPTRADISLMIDEAFMKNPNRTRVYSPNFKLTDEYRALQAEVEALKGVQPYDAKRAEEIANQMLSIQTKGTVTDEERQAEIDKTLEMPIKEVISQRNKYKQIVEECADKIDNFDLTAVQAKADALTEEYKTKLKGKSGITYETLKAEYEAKIEELEREEIDKPVNDLKIKRYEAHEYFAIYEARVKYYVVANKEIIEQEMERAKHEEVRGSLADLAEYLEEE